MATWNTPVSHDGLHVILWRRAGRGGKLVVSPSALGDELGLTAAATSRLLSDLVDEGRMKAITRRKGAQAVFAVVDPRRYFADHGTEDEPAAV